MRGNVDEIDNLRPEWRPHGRDHRKSATAGKVKWACRGAGPVIISLAQ